MSDTKTEVVKSLGFYVTPNEYPSATWATPNGGGPTLGVSSNDGSLPFHGGCGGGGGTDATASTPFRQSPLSDPEALALAKAVDLFGALNSFQHRRLLAHLNDRFGKIGLA